MDNKFNLSRWINHVTPVISWIIFCPSAYSHAFAQSGTQRPENSNGSYTTLDPSMAIVVLILVTIFFILAMFSIYVHNCSESADGSALQSRVGMDLSRRRGVDPAVIETFPIFVYSEVKDLKIGKGTLECAVCLSEFEDDETLRLLPRCDHVFHRDCVDAWLASHVTCPVCRAVLRPEAMETVKLTDSNNEFTQIQSNSTSDLGEDRNRVVIDISSDEQSSDGQVIETSDVTAMRNRPSRIGIPDKFPRSHSTGHSLVLAGVNTDRYTLKLPEDVRKQLMMTVKLKRTVSFNVLAREGSSRGYKYGGGECSSGGRSYVDRQDGRSERWVFSMTPPFVSKTGSVNLANKVVGGGDEEGSNSNGSMLLNAVKSPLNCLNVKIEHRGDLCKQ